MKPFWTGWYSHKFKGPGLRYEVGVAIQSDNIVWINGPYPPGRYPDIKIFRDGLKQLLMAEGERCEADDGYRGEPLTVELPGEGCFYGGAAQNQLKKRVRSRHETVNGRFKCFQCLNQKFRHKLSHHRFCFNSIVVLTQLGFDHGNDHLMQIEIYATETL